MARKVTRLQLEPDYDFSLIAVVSNLRDYKLCFELNDCMRLDLKRAPDLEIADKDRNRSWHVYYTCDDREGQRFELIGNKGSAGYFVPEKKNIQYFLVIRHAGAGQADLFYRRLRGLAWLEGAYKLDPAKLRSAEKFLMFE
jgi:hypothetical protein